MTVYINATAPQGASVRLTRRTGSTFDFSTVTDVAFEVSKPDKSIVTWDASIESQSTTELIIRHVFQTGDLPIAGLYILVPKLTVAGGTVDGELVEMPVKNPHKRKP